MPNYLVEFVDDAVANESTVVDDTEYIEILISTPVSVAVLEIQEYLELPDSWISVRTASSDIQFSMANNLVIKIGDGRYPVHAGVWKISSITAMVGTAPSGASVVVDINKNGVSIFPAGKVVITAGTLTGTVGSWNDLTFTSGDYITVDVDGIGSGAAGANLTVSVLLERIT